jgi:hypothetical protein
VDELLAALAVQRNTEPAIAGDLGISNAAHASSHGMAMSLLGLAPPATKRSAP